VFDDPGSLGEITKAYGAVHKNVSFEQRTLRYDEYEDALLHAFAEGTGPDIFSIPNTWIGEYEPLISPLPKTLTIPYTEIRGTIKKETVITLKEEPALTERELKANFVDAVAADVVRSYKPNANKEAERRIFGLPLAMDTLALYYNKDLFNAAGIAEPPTSWTEFQADVTKLTTIGPNDSIVQSGAAIGGSRNVERAFDILSVLMMQNGTKMTDANGGITFGAKQQDDSNPGGDAVRFYAEFADTLKSVYAWNAEQPGSFEAFATGKTAMFLGYSYHAPLIRQRAPKLSFAVAPLPQISSGRVVNMANYWVETVSKSTKNANWAWDFVQFAAKADHVKSYLTATGKPTALRALINEELADENLAVFAGQLLTAKSWYAGKNATVAESAFLDLIDQAVAGGDVDKILLEAVNKVSQTL
jgi:multiple sugar transport system substrate-binding protein